MSRSDVFYGAAAGYGSMRKPNRFMLWGAGSPAGVTSAEVGSLYMDTASGTVYSKTSGTGTSGWVALSTGGGGGGSGAVTASAATTFFGSPGTQLPVTAMEYDPLVMSTDGSIVGLAISCATDVPYGTSTSITAGYILCGAAVNNVAYGPTVAVDVDTYRNHQTYTPGLWPVSAGDVVDVAVGCDSLEIAPAQAQRVVVTVFVQPA